MDTNEIVAKYGAAWNEPDDVARADLLAASWADAGVYQDPTATVEGRDALVAHIAGFQQTFSGHVIDLTSAVDTNGAALRWGWAMRNGDEIVIEGIDVAALAPDGRILRIDGFFGPLPELTD